MGALELGLMAAMCWGFHDVCVRFISQKTPISACIFVVLIVGLIFHICLMIPENNFSLITKTAFVYSSIAGIFFVIASFSLYYSLKRGPVRLVAPLIASYPILSITWAIWIGTPVSILQVLAVIAIIFGVSIVAIMSDNSEDKMPPISKTILTSLIAAAAFAVTFASGQAAAELSPHMSVTLITRIISILSSERFTN